jgi:hypothetical protein
MSQYEFLHVKYPLKKVYEIFFIKPRNLRPYNYHKFNKYRLNHFATAILSSSIVIERIEYSYHTSEFDGKSLIKVVHKSIYT